jgi:UDP-3-O-[3-hydroxymyristoyl] glucosamine N-acyltransferase
MLLSTLARKLGGRLTCPGDLEITGLATIDQAGQSELTFLANDKYARFMSETQAAAVIVSEDYEGPGERLLRCEDPYFAFRNAAVELHGFRRHPFEGIDASARIDPSASVADGAAIGPNVYVGPRAQIGPQTALYPNVFVGPDCRLGTGCILYPSVTLYDGSRLGDRVTIHAGSSIGQDGFGYATHEGVHHKIPQAGWVEIDDDVEIGACCAIDRAAIGPTSIGAGTKFSNLIVIGHGTRLGKHCLVVAQAGIAGSVQIDDYCVFGGQAGVAGHVKIGPGVRVGGRGGVTKDLEAGEQYWGTPAQPLSEARRTNVLLRSLPRMHKQVQQLKQQIHRLEQQLQQRRQER